MLTPLPPAPPPHQQHLASSNQLVTRPTDNVIFYNASYQDLTRPVQGPANPWNDNKLERQNALTGHVEQQHFSEHSFREQQRTFHVLGYAANPSIAAGTSAAAPTFVGNAGAAMGNQGATAALVKPSRREVREMKRKRMAKGTLGEFDDPDEAQEEAGAGAAAGEGAADGAGAQQDNVDGDDDEGAERQAKRAKKPQREYVGPWAGWEGESLAVAIPTEEEYEEQEAQGGPLLSKEERRKKVLEDANRREVGFGQEKSVFHGESLALSACSPLRRALSDSRSPHPAQARRRTTTSGARTCTSRPTSRASTCAARRASRSASSPSGASTRGAATPRASAASRSSPGAGTSSCRAVSTRASRCVASSSLFPHSSSCASTLLVERD